ncbi:hypothetical protein HA466_0040360 [Hirschfeldia incana]|nr:hypothetical protein HA466_0040360 [Hirschfeldia incana]
MGNVNGKEDDVVYATSHSARSNGGDPSVNSHHQRPSSDSLNSSPLGSPPDDPSPSPYLFIPKSGDADSASGFNVYTTTPSSSVRPNSGDPHSPGSPARSQMENEKSKEDNPSGVDDASSARPDSGGYPSIINSSSQRSPSPTLFVPQEELSKEAEFHTNVLNLRKMAQELLEKGYNEKGMHISTMVKFFEKDSKDPQNVPYCKWLVGMDSMVTSVGSSHGYWNLSTGIDYKNLPLSKDFFFVVDNIKFCGANIMFDNKPKVSGDISFGFDCVKLVAGVGWQNSLESKIELLGFWEHLALKVRASNVDTDSILPKRLDIAAAVHESWMKLAAEVSYDVMARRFFSYSIGGAIQTNDFLASVTYWRDSLIGSCVKKFPQFDMGIEVSKPISSAQCTMTFGVCKSEAEQLYKMKINNFGVLSGSIVSNLWPKALVSVSSELDLKNMGKSPRFGLKVLFNSPAVVETYDIGEEGWEKS